MARLRSRITWLGEGDANTKFFHIHARHHNRRNFVAKLTDGGHILTGHSEKAAAVDLFYKNLIGQDRQRDVTIDLAALGLPRYNLAALDSPFTEQEVLETIKGLPSDKAPGPDGFTGLFYKVCWNIVKVMSWQWYLLFGAEDLSISGSLTLPTLLWCLKKMGLSKLRTSGQLASSTALQN
jgi:hypothetical protein